MCYEGMSGTIRKFIAWGVFWIPIVWSSDLSKIFYGRLNSKTRLKTAFFTPFSDKIQLKSAFSPLLKHKNRNAPRLPR